MAASVSFRGYTQIQLSMVGNSAWLRSGFLSSLCENRLRGQISGDWTGLIRRPAPALPGDTYLDSTRPRTTPRPAALASFET